MIHDDEYSFCVRHSGNLNEDNGRIMVDGDDISAHPAPTLSLKTALLYVPSVR